jgi:hypothetical protein
MGKKQKQIEVNVSEVVDYLRINGQFLPALQQVVERNLTVAAAKKLGLKVSKVQLQKAADTFRIANSLNKAKDTEDWLASRGITIEYFEEYLEHNLLISKFKDELAKKTSKTKYYKDQSIEDSVRNMIYQDWLTKEIE